MLEKKKTNQHPENFRIAQTKVFGIDAVLDFVCLAHSSSALIEFVFQIKLFAFVLEWFDAEIDWRRFNFIARLHVKWSENVVVKTTLTFGVVLVKFAPVFIVRIDFVCHHHYTDRISSMWILISTKQPTHTNMTHAYGLWNWLCSSAAARGKNLFGLDFAQIAAVVERTPQQ